MPLIPALTRQRQASSPVEELSLCMEKDQENCLERPCWLQRVQGDRIPAGVSTRSPELLRAVLVGDKTGGWEAKPQNQDRCGFEGAESPLSRRDCKDQQVCRRSVKAAHCLQEGTSLQKHRRKVLTEG